jgi:hypothetical protein
MPDIDKINNVAVADIDKFQSTTFATGQKVNNQDVSLVITYTEASGGDSTATDGDYKVHTFLSSANLNITTKGTADIEYLIIAGGGAGGGMTFSGRSGAGGGAGGLLNSTSYSVKSTGNHAITVGAGGAGHHGGWGNWDEDPPGSTVVQGALPTSGNDSVWNSGNTGSAGIITADGGGFGSSMIWNTADGYVNVGGEDGGSGGGGTGDDSPQRYGGDATAGQGYDGGTTDYGSSSMNQNGAGGGGAGAVGGTPSFDTPSDIWTAGPGGAGASNDITGSAVTYAGGGGGGATDRAWQPDSLGGPGGSGGGADGGDCSSYANSTGHSGTDGLGGGGGGNGSGNRGTVINPNWPTQGCGFTGGDGGDGIVIVRYQFQE